MIIQSDFDGTLTEEDVSFALLDAFAEGDWRKLYEQYRQNKMTVGDFNTRAFAMVKAGRDGLLRVAREEVKLREGLRNIENNVNMSGILPSGLVGFTEVVMAVLLVVILILRPSGIMGGRELRWPPRHSRADV